MLSHEPSASPRPVAILIVAYRSPELLVTSLRSARRHLPDCTIHVWDNSAPSDEVRRIAADHPDVRWWFSEQNIGFAAAVNRLAEQVPGHDLLLLNPDAELVGPLSRTRSALQDSRVAAAAPMVEGPDIAPLGARQSARWDVAHRRLTFLNSTGTAAGLGERLRGTPLSNLYRRQPADVDGYISGACLAISGTAWDAVGPFDEDFFLYGEEADWQQRAIDAGWRIQLADEVGVRHRAMGTVAGDKPAGRRSVDLLRANQALLLEHRRGQRWAELFLAWVSVAEIIRRAVHRRHIPPGCGVLVCCDGPDHIVLQRVSVALQLARDGQRVTVVALQRLGELPRLLPPPIRLVRSAWWWPSATPESIPPVLISVPLPTRRERVFARLFRLRRGTRVISLSSILGR